MRKTRPCSGPRPPAIATWKRSRATVRSASGSMPGETSIAVTDTERASGTRVNRRSAPPSAQRVDGGVHRARQARVAGVHVGQALGGDQAERGLEAGQVGERRRAAELAVREARCAGAASPSRSAAPGCARAASSARASAATKARPGWTISPFCDGADRDVDAERIHRERRRCERGDDVDDEQRRVRGGVDRGAQRGEVAGRAAGGVGVDDEDRADAMRGVVAQHRLDGGRIDRPAFDVGRAHGAAAERLDLLGPAVGEVAGARHQDRRAGRDQVGDHRLPAAVAVGGVEEDLGALGLRAAPSCPNRRRR